MSTLRQARPVTLEALSRELEAGKAVELIDGTIVEKTSPTVEHGATQIKLGFILDPFNRKPGGPRGPGGWWLMTEVEVLYDRTGEVFRHDALGFRRELHPARPTGMPVRTRPDWACEILSTSTARYDLVKKQRTLHAHAVPHYWIIDPTSEILTVMRWTEAGYLRVLDAGVDEVVNAEPFEATPISMAELFGRE